MSTPDIVVLGNANVDLTTYVEHAPAEGETVIGHDFTIGMGGKGANQAVAAARAGSKVAFIGRRGDDAFGDIDPELAQRGGSPPGASRSSPRTLRKRHHLCGG